MIAVGTVCTRAFAPFGRSRVSTESFQLRLIRNPAKRHAFYWPCYDDSIQTIRLTAAVVRLYVDQQHVISTHDDNV